MQKFIIFIITTLLTGCFFSCSTDTIIVRQLYPITRNIDTIRTNYTSLDTISESRDGVTFTLDYIDKQKLYILGRNNRSTFTADRTLPLLTVFLLTIKNERTEKIKIDPKIIFLTDEANTKYKLLDNDTFKEMYPNIFDQSSDFSFLFDPSVVSLQMEPIRKKKKKEQKQPLFKGGLILPQSTVKSILVFPYIEEVSRNISITIPSIEIYDKEKPKTTKEFRFQFLQTKTRIEEKKR